MGQSRQTNTPDEFAACPLYLQLRLYRWTATNRREVPDSDIHPIYTVNQGTGYGCSGTGELILMAAPPFSPG